MAQSKANLKLNILAADSDIENQEKIRSILSQLGHDVTVVSDGIETLERLKYTDFDLILLDIAVPRLDGFTAAQFIRSWGNEKAKTPIVAISDSERPGESEKCFQLGINEYVPKLLLPEAIIGILQKYSKAVSEPVID